MISNQLNERLEKAMERTDKIQKSLPLKAKLPFRSPQLTGKHRSLLFINPNDVSIQMCIYSLENGFDLPKWALPLGDDLLTAAGRLFYRVHGKLVPFACEEKRSIPKNRRRFSPSRTRCEKNTAT